MRHRDASRLTGYGLEMHVSGDYRDLFGRDCPIGALEQSIGHSNLGEQIYSVARCVALFMHPGTAPTDLVTKLAQRRDELDPRSRRILDRIIDASLQGRVFNAPHVMLNLAKYLLAHGNLTTWERDARHPGDPYVTILTILHSAMISSNFAWADKYDIEGILLGSVRNSVFNTHTDVGAVLQRGMECFVHLPRQRDRFERREYIDVENLFRQATGVPLEQYLLIVSGLIALFLTDSKSVDELLWTMDWRYDLQRYVHAFGSPNKDVCQRVLEDLSISPDEFRREFSDSVCKGYDVSYFRNKPIVQIQDTFFPIYPRFLSDAVWDRVYFKIVDNVSSADAQKFRAFFGRLFETYCQDLLVSVENKIKGELIREFAYGRDNKRSPDAMIKYGNQMVVFEFKAKRLNMTRTMVHGDWSAFQTDLEMMVFGPVRQIYNRLKEMYKHSGLPIELKDIRRIHPVIVTQGTFSGMKQLYAVMDDMIRQRGYYDELPIEKWHIMDVNEFEALVGTLYGRQNLINLLMRKAQNAEYRHLPFNNYFHKIKSGHVQAPIIKERGSAIFDQLFGQLSQDQTQGP